MITMQEIDELRNVLSIERETLRSLIDHHLGVSDAIERVKKAEAAVEEALRQWWAQDCVEAEPAPSYWKMRATANRLDAKMYAKAADSEKEGQRIALAALKEAETKLREEPCVDEAHENRDALPERIAAFVRATWGEKNLTDPWERTMRVVEEAIEFAQANGITEAFIVMLLRRVYDRPIGDPKVEMGNLGVTCLAWCISQGASLDDLMLASHNRIETIDREKLREKHRKKVEIGIALPLEGEDRLP